MTKRYKKHRRFTACIGDQWHTVTLTADEVATACHVTKRTAQRWLTQDPPSWAEELIAYKTMLAPNDLAALVYVYQERNALRLRVASQAAEIKRLKENRDHWRTLSGAPIAVNEEDQA